MVSSFFTLLTTFSAKLGYWGILLLMTIESSFVPFPSEIVIPPAAFLAQAGEMNIFLVIFFGVLGSLLGASINYFLARSLGRALIFSLVEKKIFKLMLLNRNKIEVAEKYFLKYGRSSTFFGRLVPAVRQLISLPAGFSKMPYKNFLFYTFLGSSIWVTILALLGYYFGANKELFARYYEELKYVIIIVFVLFVAFVSVRIKKDYQKAQNQKNEN